MLGTPAETDNGVENRCLLLGFFLSHKSYASNNVYYMYHLILDLFQHFFFSCLVMGNGRRAWKIFFSFC